MFGILTKVEEWNRKFIPFYLKRKFPFVRFGINMKCYGLPVLNFNEKSVVDIGENVTFINFSRDNMVGLFKRCSIYVGPGAKLKIGNNSGFSGVSIYCSNEIIIGDFVNCGGNVCIWDTDFHPLNYEERRVHKLDKIVTKNVYIDDDVFIGANTLVLKGVTIGKRSIIGAGSVVSKDIPADEIWAGNPIRFIKKINKQ